MPYVVIVHATFNSKADADHIYNQSLSVATTASVADIGNPDRERSSYCVVGEELNGEVQVSESWYIDIFGILRVGTPDLTREPPLWVMPVGAQDAYPAFNVRGDETQVEHLSQVWRNTHGNSNVWEPGVFGWDMVE